MNTNNNPKKGNTMSTNTKHTPGQWHIGSGNGEGSIFADNGRTRFEIGGTTLYPICQVNRKWEDEEDEANARLIAAAPELLQAILDLFRECAIVHKYWGDGANTKEADAAIKRAKDAIAKATGQD